MGRADRNHDETSAAKSAMKAIFISPVHPDTPHVSSMRMRYFADALARRGHRIVLLTPPLEAAGHASDLTPDAVECAVAAHDWTVPLHVSTPLSRGRWLLWLRDERLPAPVRRAASALLLAFLGGPESARWVAGARPYRTALGEGFRPDMIWATFGGISTLVLAQSLAKAAGAPWVMDIKDNWEAFVRPPLCRFVANRFRDAVAFTANSRHHEEIAAKWHTQPHIVIYSGVVPEMIAPEAARPDPDVFRITLTGSVYDGENKLKRFLGFLTRWLNTLTSAQRDRIEFHYAGSAAEKVDHALHVSPLPCRTFVQKSIPLRELGTLCQRAAVNCYIWYPVTFHHKLLELLCCGRPVLSFPGEHEESIQLAAEVGGDLRSCSGGEDVNNALDDVWSKWESGSSAVGHPFDSSGLSWGARAAALESFLLARLQSSRG
jgi:hypothetical protein